MNALLAVLAIAGTASVASAETLLMPDRDMLAGTSEVVWGITTLPNGAATTYTIDFGDGFVDGPTVVSDRSYIAVNHTYAVSGPFTVTLTVQNGGTTEFATAKVNVYNGALLSAEALRELNVNRTIQDGLRYLWVNQSNRTTFNTTIETAWGNYPNPFTALAVQAFQNQGYRLPNDDTTPTGIYAKYAVRRGINYMLARLTPWSIGATPAGNDACAGSLPAISKCSALYATTTGQHGYENGMVMLAIAGSGALARINTEVVAANVTGQTYGAILQRIVNASIYGQQDSGVGRGGWHYTFNSNDGSDGSVDGWELLGLLDAKGAGATVPSWVNTEWATYALPNALNNDGSFDYAADANRARIDYPNVAKVGVGIQGMYFAGRLNTDPDLALAKTLLGNNWSSGFTSGVPVVGYAYPCSGTNLYNKGCAYGMFNVFKGLKLFGVQTLTGVNRAAGPGAIPADDWYADYVDWLVENQTNPRTLTGGTWNRLYFSGAYSYDATAAASIALLILSPTALVLPDPVTFASLGLQQGSPLSINPMTNPVTTPPGTHTVTGITVATNGSPVPGVTVGFKVLSGPNAGAAGSATTDVNGQATFTYTDTGGAGTDKIQANVGAFLSNILTKNWVVQGIVCDINNDGVISPADLKLFTPRLNTVAKGKTDPYDPNRDGRVNAADVRYCQLRQTATTP
jgi:hypothetical protein